MTQHVQLAMKNTHLIIKKTEHAATGRPADRPTDRHSALVIILHVVVLARAPSFVRPSQRIGASLRIKRV